jgi:hypothetical protein
MEDSYWLNAWQPVLFHLLPTKHKPPEELTSLRSWLQVDENVQPAKLNATLGERMWVNLKPGTDSMAKSFFLRKQE